MSLAVENIPIYGLARLIFQWLPSFLLRRHYSADRLAKLIYVDFLPRCESARVNLGEVADVQISLQLINLSPFVVEIDRCSFELMCAGSTLYLSDLTRRTVAPGATINLYLKQSISDGQANQMTRTGTGGSAWLQGNLEFNCDVRQFAKNIGNLSNVQVTAINGNARPTNIQTANL